jgi:hypothetical protein
MAFTFVAIVGCQWNEPQQFVCQCHHSFAKQSEIPDDGPQKKHIGGTPALTVLTVDIDDVRESCSDNFEAAAR